MDKTDKIVIVGGGSAGWMTAAMLVKAFPNRDITVIESDEYPIIGVGESTIAPIRQFCRFIDLDESEFLEKTNGSYKLSIQFTDFDKKNGTQFHYPFGLPAIIGGRNPFFDWHLKKHFYPDTPYDDFVKTIMSSSHLFLNNKYSPNLDNEFDAFVPELHVAYHFDAVLFGKVLKEKYCTNKGVTHIVDTVSSVELGEKGIEYLTLKSGEKVFADLYIDCTGFKSLLLAGALKEPFKSYEHLLPNNSAIAVQIPYENKELELHPYTNCTAIENGWCWNVPLWSRLGTGYTYSNKYVSQEDALVEFKRYLMSNRMTIPRTSEQVDALTYRYLSMRIGIHERTFVKNVVAIGLSAGFIEPLESSGLYTVHHFMFKLIHILSRSLIKQYDRDMYNRATYEMFHQFAEFVELHYALSDRDDTPYWQDATSGVRTQQVKPGDVEGAELRLVGDRYMNTWEHTYGYDGTAYIATGQGYPMLSEHRVSEMSFNQKRDFKTEIDNTMVIWEELKAKWAKAAENSPTHYEYLKRFHKKDVQ